MKIINVQERPIKSKSAYLDNFTKLNQLIDELNTKEIPDTVAIKINELVNAINASEKDRQYLINLSENKTKIVKILENDLGLVPKNYYRNTWLILGMTTIGLPLGVCFGLLMDNMGLMGIGLPIGMVLGIGLGSSKDQKVFKENRQLQTEIR